MKENNNKNNKQMLYKELCCKIYKRRKMKKVQYPISKKFYWTETEKE